MIEIHSCASTANLGPGFDTLSIALNLENIFYCELSDEYKLINFKEEFNNENNLFITTYKYFFQENKLKDIPISVKIEENIPVSRGLGSSSSLIIAALIAANYYSKLNKSNEELLKYANLIEGHCDNVAACLYGGFIASYIYDDVAFIDNYEFNNDLKMLFIIPDYKLSTSDSRNVLPEMLPRKKVSKNIPNVLSLIKGIKDNDSKLIRNGMEDYIHVKYREKLINNYQTIRQDLLDIGVIDVTISGAGPTLLAFFNKDIDINIIKNKYPKYVIKELEINKKGSYIK